MSHVRTHTQNLVTVMLSLIDPRTDEDAAVDSIEKLDLSAAKELLTMVCSWTAGVLEIDAENKGVDIDVVMKIIEGNLRETADQMDRLDHEGGLFT